MSAPKNNDFVTNGLPKLIGAICLLAFIIFEELWIGTLVASLAFVFYFVIQVFVEKSVEWYKCAYLYAAVGCLALAWMEYQYRIISNLLGI